MKPKLLTCMLSGLLLAPLPTSSIGGWAVISVEHLPDYALSGRSFDLVFAVRQHGVEPLSGLEPKVDVSSGGFRKSVAATPTGREGVYRASLEIPNPGDWTITINSGFGPSRVTLVPITAVQAAGALPVLPAAERGRRLFVAKGCVTCHTHGEVPTEKSWNMGPDLTGKRYPEELLRQRLTDPKSVMPEAKMPNPELKSAEIAALTAFINSERQAGR
ncbi:MAG: c-type cytochrome, partial [Gemmatimonadota bacterium]|nr:c-type cytochrome [Gemmatimonadota bacterium]MDH5284778.1 c-type cytochrome [Gemmatimonadota bacterium]